MLIDTHCHLDFPEFDSDRDAVINRAKDAGVGCIINVASSMEGSKASVRLAQEYDLVYASLGIHPHHAAGVTDKSIEVLRKLAENEKVVAIGEVGLDYYRNLSPRPAQIKAFRTFLKLARELKLPLIIHSREAAGDILNIFQEELETPIRGVLHCFSGDQKMLKACLDMGLHISFTANLTFKNAGRLREMAKDVPLERLLLETDAPFLAPQALRGKRNEPGFVRYLAEELVKLKGVSFAEIAETTTENARKLFGINAPR